MFRRSAIDLSPRERRIEITGIIWVSPVRDTPCTGQKKALRASRRVSHLSRTRTISIAIEISALVEIISRLQSAGGAAERIASRSFNYRSLRFARHFTGDSRLVPNNPLDAGRSHIRRARIVRSLARSLANRYKKRNRSRETAPTSIIFRSFVVERIGCGANRSIGGQSRLRNESTSGRAR